jgi:hypothetical protein
MSIASILASQRVQSARDVLGSVVGQAGKVLRIASPAAHRSYTRALMRGPCAKMHGSKIAEHVECLEQGTPGLEVVKAISSALKQALTAGEFDPWIDQPGSRGDSSKRTLVRCDNYLPGRRWKLQLFYVPEGRSHPPHSHDDMASCLVVARGTMAAREFNRLRRLENGGDTIMLEQASDLILRPGNVLFTDDDYHNVHWFGAVNGAAVALNFQVVGFSRGKRPSEKLRSYVDPTGGPNRGPFPAARLEKNEAHEHFANRPLSAF